jgi:hypothetical protein
LPRAAIAIPEVDKLHVAVERDQDILWTNIAVDNREMLAVQAALLVRVRKTRRATKDDCERMLKRKLAYLVLLHRADD